MFSRFPSLAFIFLASLLVSITNSYAGASNKNGSPFGNGTFFQTTGTFSAVIRGQNLSGTMLFSTGVSTNEGGNSSGGSCVISYLGSTDGETAPGVYNGNAAGIWDPSQGTINGQFWGGYTLSGSNGTTIYPEIYNTTNQGTRPDGSTFSYYPYPVNIVSNGLVSTTIFITNGTAVTTTTTQVYTNITNTIYVEPVGSNSFRNSVFMNGSFNGSIQNKYPNQTFSAPGKVVIQQIYPQQQNDTNERAGTVPVQMSGGWTNQIPVTVQGIRISDGYTSFNTISNAIPFSITTYGITNISALQNVQ
jgi:hypothetical protein